MKLFPVFRMQLSQGDKYLMHNYLIPGHYLKLAADKERNVDRKTQILQNAQKLLSIVASIDSGDVYSDDETGKLNKAAIECAQLFQRKAMRANERHRQDRTIQQ